MVNKLIDIIMQMFLPKVKLVNIQLAEVKPMPIVHDLDRNYHHWVITEHTQERMKQRKISFSEINLAFKYVRNPTEDWNFLLWIFLTVNLMV